MPKNYARNIDTDELRFFDTKHGIETREIDRWAFFKRPAGVDPTKFYGRIIGESSDMRAERLGTRRSREEDVS